MTSSGVNRCYYCKKELFSRLKGMAARHGMRAVIDGTNFDDFKDIRYGMKAAKRLKVSSPLAEAEIGKPLIRKESRKRGLPTWDKPSFACLASRIPFGEKIDDKILLKIDKAERYLRSLGLKQVRVRVHNRNMARIELDPDGLKNIFRLRKRVARRLKGLGIRYITLDLEGYRTGSMNEPFKKRLTY
ncbi:ATP-dependent sacrificial sulfur transferase LarE [Candidatus Omnitrophota bacterium]